MCIFSSAQPDPRPAVLPHRPDLLPQPADLSRAGPAGAGDSGLPLCAAAGRLPVPRQLRERIAAWRPVRGDSTRSTASSSAARTAADASAPAAAGTRGRRMVGRLGRCPRPACRAGALAAPHGRGAASLERFAPAHVVVNRDGDIVHYSARTGKYLEPAAGHPSRQLLAMARQGLRLDLRSALHEAVETRRHGDARPDRGRARRSRPAGRRHGRAAGDGATDPLFLVLFADLGPPMTAAAGTRRRAASCPSAAQLERELRDTRERLQSTIEEYETAAGGAEGGQRGAGLGQRGAAVDQRGAGDLQGGAAVGQRGAAYGQPGAQRQDRAARPRQRRPAQPVRQHRHRDRLPRPRSGDPQLHRRGHRRSST